jgi:hypothetical protein
MPKKEGYGEGKKMAPDVSTNNYTKQGKVPAPGEKDRFGHEYSRKRTPATR